MSLHKTWPGWPNELSATGWDKQKGIIAKLVKGESGIGAKLEAAHKAYNKIGVGRFSDAFVDTSSKAACAAALKAAAAETASLKTCTEELAAVAKLAKEHGAKLKDSPLVPKSSTAYVGKIETEAKKFATELQSHCVAAMKEIKEEMATAP